MPSEWAINQAREDVGIFGGTSSSEPLVMAIAAELDAARAQGRREGMDEAARIADNRSEVYAGSTHKVDKAANSMCRLVAANIRAAIAKEPKA